MSGAGAAARPDRSVLPKAGPSEAGSTRGGTPVDPPGERSPRLVRLLRFMAQSALDMVRLFRARRKLLTATTRVELEQRYAGSIFGKLWVVLFPALLLFNYLFVFRIIFQMKLSTDAAERLSGVSADRPMVFVLYVFCGLIPYIGFSEAISSGCTSLKQNMHLIKNVIMPIELVAPRVVAVSMVSQVVSLGILLVLVGWQGLLSWHLLWLPVVLILQVMALVGLVWILSALGVLIPDIAYFVNVAVLFLLYVSPVIFEPSAVPEAFRVFVYANPIYYMIEGYRSSILFGRLPETWVSLTYVALCLGSFIIGAAFFRRMKDILVDYE